MADPRNQKNVREDQDPEVDHKVDPDDRAKEREGRDQDLDLIVSIHYLCLMKKLWTILI